MKNMDVTNDVVSNMERKLAHSAPIIQKDRIIFLDALRGIAVLGVLLMNIMGQGQALNFYLNMDLDQSMTGANFYSWAIGMGFFEGAMRGLLSLLFGAGTILLLNRMESGRDGLNAADIYYRRLLWLIALGLINAFVFLWPGDILYEYGIIGLALFPFRKMSASRLLIPIFILLAFSMCSETMMLNKKKEIISNGKQVEWLQSKHEKLTEQQILDLGKWKKFQSQNNSAGMMQEAKEQTTAIQGADFQGLVGIVTDESVFYESRFFYTHWWDVAFMFFVGMAYGKSGFITGKNKTWIYVAVAIVGLGVSLSMNYFRLKGVYESGFDSVKTIENSPFVSVYQIKRLLQVSGYISLLVLLYKFSPLKFFFKMLANVGQMTLTNYLCHSIITSVLFYGFGFFGKWQRYELIELTLAIWLFQIVSSAIWLKYFTYGPFEWVWRSLTYLKRQPFKRSQGKLLQQG